MRPLRRSVLLLVLAASVPVAEAAEDWREELPAAVVERLDRDKVAIAPERLKQVFQAYIWGKLPLFVTSDSILNAHHVLFEESVIRLEWARALRLGGDLVRLFEGIETIEEGAGFPGETVTTALRRARTTVATAILLAGADAPRGEPAVLGQAWLEASRVVAAEGMSKPAWLGPPDDGFMAIDYARFRPRGFYDRDEPLRRYFRAVSWLQAIPFRIDRDEELLAALVLARSLGRMGAETGVFRGHVDLLGPGDDPCIAEVSDLLPSAGKGLDRIREAIRRSGAAEINDRVAYPNREVSVRIMPSARIPDGVLFSRTTEGTPRRSPPTGLEICVALGSRWARERLAEDAGPALVRTIDASRSLLAGESLYAEYLGCLAALLDEPAPGAPAFMKGAPWRIKSCQTALSGWAQLRHTWALQTKMNVHYLGMTEPPSGFVEPDPEFFARLARLAVRTRETLDADGAFGSGLDRLELATALRIGAGVLRRAKPEELEDEEYWRGLSADEWGAEARIGRFFETLFLHSAKRSGEEELPKDPKRRAKAYESLAERLGDLEAELPSDIDEALRESRLDLEGRWRTIDETCRELESIGRKELEGEELDQADDLFLRGYGETLAGLMFYEGNSWLTPRDDAPRVVDVFSDPNRGQRLHVGIARPRVLLVLYPWKGREVLCRGAVLPYREFERAGPLTDAEWIGLLDSDGRPAAPDWLRPIELPAE